MRCTAHDPWLIGDNAVRGRDSADAAEESQGMGMTVPAIDPARRPERRVTPSAVRRSPARGALALRLGGVALAAIIAGCAPTITKHGHQFQDNDVQKVQVGMSQQQVAGVLGTPTTTAAMAGGQAQYYISSTEKQTAFFSPEETDRKVLAIYYSQYGAVERVSQYGLKDGKVINISKNQTPNSAREDNVIKSLFRNLGSKQMFGND